MNPEQLAEIEARLHEHGHLGRADSIALIGEARRALSVPGIVEMMNDAGREFDRLIATPPTSSAQDQLEQVCVAICEGRATYRELADTEQMLTLAGAQ
ncbi:hypothetical protein [Deinococcus alpinitundrae]|uniref:hypothetical protein n=1 Tax=Deinococcus alpinitundrae TaxID=468913 RepID=UPI00137A19C1|nr:hypothetical protein [Deinococcus alpinitundrae]